MLPEPPQHALMTNSGAAYEQWLEQRIADLEAQLTRLQKTLVASHNEWAVAYDSCNEPVDAQEVEAIYVQDGALEPGDLDPVKGEGDE